MVPSISQQLMDTVLSNVPGTVAYLDEILVVGHAEEEMLQRPDKVLENLIDCGLKINMENCEIIRKEIHYLGFVVSEAGRSPDPERAAVFKNVKVPKHVRELKSFIGLISYYSPVIAGLHNLKPPVNRLLCQDAKFYWSAG
ncbi:unnamed protein product [Schistocephalus solidus]|uniref:Reverse transcriptase domain-containing protein n=1 Tax=Schistocephalus solidus TaxID=70667 RepID=A0A183SQ22_SCHSO|nr:unnamed protein product [Schistocephalus solidus]